MQNEDNSTDGVTQTQLLGADCSPSVEGSCLDRVKSETKLPEGEAASSSNQRDLFVWVNDYKCSICGIELPPSFIEERQEHYDFHLAKKLQEEESGTDTRTSLLRPRYFIYVVMVGQLACFIC